MESIIQFGEGGFLRGFADSMPKKATGIAEAGICFSEEDKFGDTHAKTFPTNLPLLLKSHFDISNFFPKIY